MSIFEEKTFKIVNFGDIPEEFEGEILFIIDYKDDTYCSIELDYFEDDSPLRLFLEQGGLTKTDEILISF